MKLRVLLATATLLLLPALCLVAETTFSPEASLPRADSHARKFDPKDHPYHKHPPLGELPPTLDPEPFRDAPEAYVAYRLAAEIPDLLYQQPCMCSCGRRRGHQCLLDCFTSIHGRNCGECKLEVFYCYEQHKKGWSPKRIRKAMFKFKFLSIDFDRYAEAQWNAMTGSR